MTTRSEREKKQSQNDHYKKVLAQLIAKEENKFCADCLSKGPRWVSWNLGVLLCIRCSGIHRSLGVHISKVKSVNLDTWTSDQLANMCRRGNGWAKDKYEATLPRDFKRPQSDSSMEYFIRDKYEKLKYCTNADVPYRSIEEYNIFMKSTASSNTKSREKKKELVNGVPIIRALKTTENSTESKPVVIISEQAKPAPVNNARAAKPESSAVDDLLGLNTPVVTAAPADPVTEYQPSNDLTSDLFSCMQSNTNAAAATQANSNSFQPPAGEPQTTQNSAAAKQMSKDSILSLYSQNQPANNMQHNPYIAAGPYNMPGQANQMFSQSMGMPNMAGYQQLNMQQQGSMGMPQQHNMQSFAQQQQPYNWQQQQVQQQMHNLHLGGVAKNVPFGGLRSCNSMPQMSQQQVGPVYAAHTQQVGTRNMVNNPPPLASSQPSGLDTLGSWIKEQSNGGETLSNQLWK